MVTFVQQPQLQVPRNVTPDLAGLGREAATAITTRRQRDDLQAAGDIVREGGSIEDAATRLAQSRDPDLAALGLRQLQQARTQAEAREFRDTQFEEGKRQFGVTSGLQARRVATAEAGERRLQTKADREKKITEFFMNQFIGRPGENISTTIGRSDAPNATKNAALIAAATGDVKGAAKMLFEAEQASPAASGARKQAEKLGAKRGEQRAKIEEGLQGARRRLQVFKNLKAANEKAVTGAFSGARLKAGRVLDAFGVDPATLGIQNSVEGLSASEFMQSEQLQVVMESIQKTKGSISEKEMETFTNAAPGLANSKGGNALIIEVGETVAEREAEIARRVGRLPAGTFNADAYDRIAEDVRNAIPMPDITQPVADPGEGAGRPNIRTRQQRASEIEAELARRNRAASSLTAGGP